MNIILPVTIFASWLAFVLIPIGRLAIEDERNNVPKDKRRGVRFLPGFPILPLLAWGLALGVNYFILPWGFWTFLGIHVVLLAVSISVITRHVLHLRRIQKRG
jgi:hypothetical protein